MNRLLIGSALALAFTLAAAAPAAAQGKTDAPGQLKKHPQVTETAALADGTRTFEMQLTNTIRKSVPFGVQADQAAADATTDNPDGFRLYINGTAAQNLSAAAVGCNSFPCSPIFQVPGGLSKGLYTIYMEAFNADGQASSETIQLTVTAAPPKNPTNLRIIK